MGIGASRSATDLFELSGRDGTLYASVSGDNAFHIKGINWFGSETYCGPPGGLDRHPVGFYLDFLQRHKFNAIRLLFAHEFIEKDDIVHTAESEDPLFFQTRYLEMFTILCREAAKRGMLVMVAAHRLRHDAWPGKGLWYDDDIGWPVSRVKTSWSKLAAVLCGEWNVIAAECASRHLERISNESRAPSEPSRPLPTCFLELSPRGLARCPGRACAARTQHHQRATRRVVGQRVGDRLEFGSGGPRRPRTA